MLEDKHIALCKSVRPAEGYLVGGKEERDSTENNKTDIKGTKRSVRDRKVTRDISLYDEEVMQKFMGDMQAIFMKVLREKAIKDAEIGLDR